MNTVISILFWLALVFAGAFILRRLSAERRKKAATIVGLVVITFGAPVALIQFFGESSQRTRSAGIKESKPADHLKFSSRIRYVIDGDTIVLQNQERVRLVQIDAPESAGGNAECHGKESSEVLTNLLPKSSEVLVETDPALGQRDRYGRILGWVFLGNKNVNQELVLSGAAAVWFYRGTRTERSSSMLEAQRQAIKSGRGLWKQCRGTPVDSNQGVNTGPPN